MHIHSTRNLLGWQVLKSRAQPPKQPPPKQLWSHLSLARNHCPRLPGADRSVPGFLSWTVAAGGERGSTPGVLTFLIASMGFVEYIDLGG